MASDAPVSSSTPSRGGLGGFFKRKTPSQPSSDEKNAGRPRPSKWSMGILNDPKTVEVPGSVLLLAAHRNEPLGLRNVHARNSHSSIPAGFPVEMPTTPGGTRLPHPTTPVISPAPAQESVEPEADRKTTEDGTVILEPQPEESRNDPLNWPSWKRDVALLSLGFYCMVGGGITPLIAAGFTNVAETYHVEVESVSLTTGLYMMGLGVGSVIMSPTAILWGKRPVYLFSSILFIGTSIWCGMSPSYHSLLAARVFQGIAVSPVECLPSATIAEIFFLHERAFRIGIYTLLLLGGKNLIPLVSAAIIGPFGWRWVFYITAMVVALAGGLLFFFVPETFWDRTPTRKPHKRPSFLRRLSSRHGSQTPTASAPLPRPITAGEDADRPVSQGAGTRHKNRHVGFAPNSTEATTAEKPAEAYPQVPAATHDRSHPASSVNLTDAEKEAEAFRQHHPESPSPRSSYGLSSSQRQAGAPGVLHSASPHSSHGATSSEANTDYFMRGPNLEKLNEANLSSPPKVQSYTHNLRQQPVRSFAQQLKPFNGRLNNDKWFKVMLRPFVLFAYPAVLWSAAVYACSVGWLIVVSETLAIIYRDPTKYNFDALQTGLIYISPFIGGILGTGVAGKISDVIVKNMSRRNGGLYEPEFRLVMAIPITISTCIGLIGFGWSAEEKDLWIVPAVFFGIMSFGCSLGSTTAITFCVDSYRQYAGEALVTLNFTKNICHGLVFSLFVTHWLADDGSKKMFIWIGVIQLFVMLLTIPMYIYGKRARMWTVRQNLMEKF